MGIKETIDSPFKRSARGIADVGRNYFSQAIEVISCCREIDIKNRPDLVPKLNDIYRAAHEALEAAKKKKNKSPTDIDAAFEKVWNLLKDPDLALKVEEIQGKQDNARQNDLKIQDRLLPIMKLFEIKKAHPPGKDVSLRLSIGANKITGHELWIPTAPFGNDHTVNIALWVLIQSGKVKMNQNPHFYSSKLLDPATFSREFKIDPLSFNKKLGTKDVRVLHVLVDASSRMVLQSQDPRFYRNFGNIWSIGQPDEPVRIVKHFDGTVEATNRIDSQISESGLALRLIPGSARTSQAGKNIWDVYLTSPRNIVGQVIFQHGQLTAQLPADNNEEISGEETESEERHDSSEDDVQEQIPVAPQMKTRLQNAKETQEAEEQARAKEKARLGVDAEKEEREAEVAKYQHRAAAREAEQRAKAAQERETKEAARVEREQRAIEAAQERETKEAARVEREQQEKRDRETKEAVRVEREQQEKRDKVTKEAATKKPKLGWVRRTINYMAGK